jgi:hypothetical protein
MSGLRRTRSSALLLNLLVWSPLAEWGMDSHQGLVEVLTHISPVHSKNMNCVGDLDAEIDVAQFGPAGYRPLRVRDALASRGLSGGILVWDQRPRAQRIDPPGLVRWRGFAPR